MDTKKVKFANIIAHRGLSGIERENTASAFVAAGNRRYKGIETDVHLTADGKFIIIHNDDTEAVAGDKLSVESTSYRTLRSLRLKDVDGTKDRADLIMPSLVEYIRICKRYGKQCVLEIKNAFPPAYVEEIAKVFDREEYFENAIFISFCYDNLVSMRGYRRDAAVQFLTDKMPDRELIGKLSKNTFDIDIQYKALTADAVRELHHSGIIVNCWTVDNPQDAERLAEYGVDYITSNILEPDFPL